MNLVRRLIDRIVLNPVADGKGGTALSIDLHGHLANILSLGLKAKKPLNSGPEIKYLKLVAGARFDTYVRVAFG